MGALSPGPIVSPWPVESTDTAASEEEARAGGDAPIAVIRLTCWSSEEEEVEEQEEEEEEEEEKEGGGGKREEDEGGGGGWEQLGGGNLTGESTRGAQALRTRLPPRRARALRC